MIHYLFTDNDEIYTIESEDNKILMASVFLLGMGNYRTTSNETDFKVPITTIGPDKGTDIFNKIFKTDLKYFIKKNNIKIADCLTTIVKGDLKDRIEFINNIKSIINKKNREIFVDNYVKNDEVIKKSFEIATQLIDFN